MPLHGGNPWFSLLVLLVAITPTDAAITLDAKVGQEFVYGGTAEWSQSVTGKPSVTTKGAVTIRALCTRSDDAKRYQTIQFRHFAMERKPEEAEVAADATVEIVPYDAEMRPTLAPFEASGMVGMHLRVMGVPFSPRLNLHAGDVWRQTEPLSVTSGRTGEVISQVIGQAKVGDRVCWKIAKKLAQPLPLQERNGNLLQEEVTAYDQALDVEAQTGHVVRSELSLVTRFVALDREFVTRARIQITLREVGSLSPAARETREAQAETLTAAGRMAVPLQGDQKTLEAMETITARVVALREKEPDSPYAPAFARMELVLAGRRHLVEKQVQARSLIGKPAPDFELKGLDGKENSLAEYRGKRVILKFFSSGCVPCHQEAPYVEQLWQQFRDKGTVIVGIDTWEGVDPEGKARDYRDRHKLTFPILVDADSTMAAKYGVWALPSSVTIDAEGNVEWRKP